MVILKYWGLMAIQLFSAAWGVMADMAAIDRTEACMLILKYWGLMAIQLFSVAWGIMAGMAAIDLTLIGHIKGWRRIKYSKWLGGAIDEKRRYGYEIVSDQTTHPQVIWFLFGCLLVLGGIIGLIVGVWQFVNDVDAWVLWTIAAALYVPSIVCLVALKRRAKQTYLSFKGKQTF